MRAERDHPPLYQIGEIGVKATDEAFAARRIERDPFPGEWSCAITPNP